MDQRPELRPKNFSQQGVRTREIRQLWSAWGILWSSTAWLLERERERESAPEILCRWDTESKEYGLVLQPTQLLYRRNSCVWGPGRACGEHLKNECGHGTRQPVIYLNLLSTSVRQMSSLCTMEQRNTWCHSYWVYYSPLSNVQIIWIICKDFLVLIFKILLHSAIVFQLWNMIIM